QEAYIIAEAGVPGGITIATNMAGRGTDIKLGGSPEMRILQETAGITDLAEKEKRIAEIRSEVEQFRERVLNAAEVIEIEPAKGDKPAKTITKPGGLYIIGSERHESRRIDNQLRGRSGRQGDPGRSKFFLSLEDDLMNDQRKVIFEQRIDLMRDENVSETVSDMRHDVIEDFVAKHIPANAYAEQWDVAGLDEAVRDVLALDLPVQEWAKEEGIADEEVRERILRRADELMAAKVAQYGPDVMRYVEKSILLQTLDHLWREHLVMLEHLRQVIGLRGYGQRDPLNEYKAEAFSLFEAMIARLREAVTGQLMRVEVVQQQPQTDEAVKLPYMEAHKVDPSTGEDEMAVPSLAPALVGNGNGNGAQAVARDPNNPTSWGKVGRNESCPCGSGKKY